MEERFSTHVHIIQLKVKRFVNNRTKHSDNMDDNSTTTYLCMKHHPPQTKEGKYRVQHRQIGTGQVHPLEVTQHDHCYCVLE